ncbi:MAG: VanW family protein [bacterium]|jgi:vancomycin resistance protein YoaR
MRVGASKVIGLTVKAAIAALVFAAVILTGSRDYLLIPQDVLKIAGIAIAEPEPAPLVVSVHGDPFVIYPGEIGLSYFWQGSRPVAEFDEQMLRRQIEFLATLVNREPRDAMLNLLDLSVLPEVPGMRLNVDETIRSCEAMLSRAPCDEMAPAVFDSIPAQMEAADIGGFSETPVGEYTTKFPKWQFNRNYNIALCASFFNGKILMPGEELSFNATTGDRTYSTGYKSAPVIENQELVPGVGGGSCQVSTTLYNAACLEAGMAVVERWPHGLAVHYIGWNRDATVAYPHRDLKFVNTYDSPVLITSSVDEDSITFKVFAKPGARNLITEQQLALTRAQMGKTAPPLRPKPKPEQKKPEEQAKPPKAGEEWEIKPPESSPAPSPEPPPSPAPPPSPPPVDDPPGEVDPPPPTEDAGG